MANVVLENEEILVEIDPGRGADFLKLLHKSSGVDLLFSTPWRERADAIRAGVFQPVFTESRSAWLEQYRGGWQTLCPNAGPARTILGAPVGFHGEASIVGWTVLQATEKALDLYTTLFSIPLKIEREIVLNGSSVSILDTLTNLSNVELEFDYSHHPAFGGKFLEGRCYIQTGATGFVADSEDPGASIEPGSVHMWPMATDKNGTLLDLQEIPVSGVERSLFGWLTDFENYWASITNFNLGLTVRLDWDGQFLPHAWMWQELNSSAGFPWFKRARVIAIEPASTQTSGPDRRSALRLLPNECIQIPLLVSLLQGGENA